MSFFKNITVFHCITLFFSVFIFYALFNVYFKVQEHKKYDMERILSDIKKKYPKSELTFQNIIIEANHPKKTYSENGALEYYYEKKYVYIKDNQLQKEANYIWMLFAFPPLLFLTIFHQNPRTLKVKDLHQVSLHTWSWIIGSIFITMIMFISPLSENRYVSPYRDVNEFNRETTILLGELNLDNYKIQTND